MMGMWNSYRKAWTGIISGLMVWACFPIPAVAEEGISYNSHVRPILAEHCFACHGQDASARKAGLRLDTASGATGALKFGGAAIVPGDFAQSVLYQRVTSNDPDTLMPPPETGKTLSVEEQDILRRWIAGGRRIRSTLGLCCTCATGATGRG